MSETNNDKMETAEEPMAENVPMFLRPEFGDIFPSIANMLDIRSFMNLARTSKAMYKRCTEDKKVKIYVEESCLEVFDGGEGVEFCLKSPFAIDEHMDGYIAALGRFHSTVSLGKLRMHSSKGIPILSATSEYLKKMGVYRIGLLDLDGYFSQWKKFLAFVKEFNVHKLSISRTVPIKTLESLLKLNLVAFEYDGPVSGDFVLNLDSPIKRIMLYGMKRIDHDQFMQILWKIQSGSLRHIGFNAELVDLSLFDNKLPFDYEGPIPADRPLVFERRGSSRNAAEYWFLHWQGGVTKCAIFSCFDDIIEIYKCEPNDYPAVLRTESDVLNQLKENRPLVACTASQFHKFMETFSMVDPSHEGPLPDERPLYFKASEERFWLLKENLMECEWTSGYAKFEDFDSYKGKPIGHPALAQHMFKRFLQGKEEFRRSLYCEGAEECDRWFKEFEKVDFEYSGTLPNGRPLIFERKPSEDGKNGLRVVLFDDFILQCELIDNHQLTFEKCQSWKKPPILMTAEDIKDMLQSTPVEERNNGVEMRVGLEMFKEGFELFKTSPFDHFHQEWRPLIWENCDGIEEYWYSIGGTITKIQWENGRLHLSKGDFQEAPADFKNQLFKLFAQTNCCVDGVILDADQFKSCLEQFKVVIFDYTGPVTTSLPVAFVKDKKHHSGRRRVSRFPCDPCVWFLWDDLTITYASRDSRSRVHFREGHCHRMDLPPALNSKEFLKAILQSKLERNWIGKSDDFLACLKDYVKLPFDYDGPLPDDRPLLFAKNEKGGDYFLLHEDGTVTHCEWDGSSANFRVLSAKEFFILPALKSLK